MAVETKVNAPSLVRNVLDIPDDTIIYDSITDHPASFIKKVVAKTAAPNSFRTRKEFYGKFLTVLEGAADSSCMFDPILAAMKSNGQDTATDAGLFVCLVWVQELSPLACPAKDDFDGYKRVADNGGVFKSYFYAGNRAMEYGEDVLVSFMDPATRKEGVFVGPLKGGAPQGVAGAGGAGGGPGGGSGGGSGGFGGSPSSFNFKCDKNGVPVVKKSPPAATKEAPKNTTTKAATVKKELKSEGKKGDPFWGDVQGGLADAQKIAKGQSPDIKKENIKPDANCPKPFGDMGNFPRVVDARAATIQNANTNAKTAKLLSRKRFRASRMKKCVAIIFHQTAIPSTSRSDEKLAGKKAGGTSCHFWCNPNKSFWWYDFETPVPTSHNFNWMPTIGIEINHHAEGVLGSPAKSKNAGKRSMTHYVPGDKPGRKTYRSKKLWYGVQNPTTVRERRQVPQVLSSKHRETLRQTVKFICNYLQKTHGTRVFYIGTHRNAYAGKPSCPGDFAIRAVGAPLMKELGLQPWPGGAPMNIEAGGHTLRLSGKGSPMAEAFFAGTKFENQFKGVDYVGKSRAYTKGNWNARPTGKGTLTWQEAMNLAGTYKGDRG